jgi:hypothetical protein
MKENTEKKYKLRGEGRMRQQEEECVRVLFCSLFFLLYIFLTSRNANCAPEVIKKKGR